MNPTPTDLAPAVPPSPLALLQTAVERGLDADQLGKLMDLADRWKRGEAEAAFNAALTRAQSRMPLVVRDAENKFTGSRYARLETVIETCRPVWTAEGFSISFTEEKSEVPEHIRVVAIVGHSSGFTRRHWGDFALDDAGAKGGQNKNRVQAKGSTFSYARRYLICLVFNIAIANEDTDGSPAGDTLNGAQVKEINDLCAQLEAAGKAVDWKRFLAWLNVESLADLPQREMGKATHELRRRLRENGGAK